MGRGREREIRGVGCCGGIFFEGREGWVGISAAAFNTVVFVERLKILNEGS